MLNENKNIDQIFRDKLAEYDVAPPLYLWTNIQGKLNARRRERRFAILKTASIAAALVLAFLAGWWMTNPTNKDTIRQNSVAQHADINKSIDPSTIENTANTKALSVNSDQDTSGNSGTSKNADHSASTKLSSLATFAANTSFIGNTNSSTVQKPTELILYNTEKEFLDELHQNFKMVKKLTDWIAAVRKDSISLFGSNSNAVINNHPYAHASSDKPVNIAMNNLKRDKGRWSLKAEFAPVFNNQAQSNRGGSDLNSINPTNSKTQETTSENTFSGGMVAGYKVGKRLIVKSGFVYNNIRQSTHNVDFMGSNPVYNVAGNTALASTPAGQVNLSRMSNTRTGAILNSDYQLNYSANTAIQNLLKQDIGFIEIPLQATYKLIDKKIAVGLTGGISTNILVGNKAILSENGEKISTGETSNMRNIVYSTAVGLEIGYAITNRITLTVEPRLKQFINSISTNKSVNYKPSQMAIVTGLTYSFN